MDQVTLDEVRQELSNWPLVMREQQMGSEVVELEIKNTEADRAKYPRLFAFLEMARADANAASSLDAQIPFPEVIVISANETQGAAFSAITFDDGKKGRLLTDSTLRERVTEMHQAMQWAFKAYDETVTYCNQTFVSADMQNAVIEAVKQRLVEGILHQVYPSSTSEISDNYSIMQPGN